MKNKAAQALGRLAKGKPKTRSPEWLKVQQENARRARLKRWKANQQEKE
jgi:hypothetical protein